MWLTLGRLEKCEEELLKWDRETFSHVGLKIRKLEEPLRVQCDVVSGRPTLGLIKE